MPPTVLFKVIGKVHVIVHSQDTPSAQEWKAYLADLKTHSDRITTVFAYTLGGGPSATQRTMFSSFWSEAQKDPIVVVMTSSLAVRGMATAVSWFLKNPIRTFALENMDEALTYLKLDKTIQDAIRQFIRQSVAQMGG